MKNEEERPLKVIWEVFSILQFLREVAGVSSLGEGLELPPAKLGNVGGSAWRQERCGSEGERLNLAVFSGH